MIDWNFLRRQEQRAFLDHAHQQWEAMSPEERHRIVEARKVRAREDAERRHELEEATAQADRDAQGALATLNAAGCPGLVARHGMLAPSPTRIQALLDIRPKYVPVELEPAWPVGAYAWRSSKRIWQQLRTGITPTGHLVPMEHAAHSDTLYVDRPGTIIGCGYWEQHLAEYIQPPSYAGRLCSDFAVASALHAVIDRHQAA